MFSWWVGCIRSHWSFSLKKQRKINHLLVQLIQISVPETHWLAEQKALLIKWLTPVNYSTVRIQIQAEPNHQSGKNITVNNHQKEPHSSVQFNSSTQGFFLSFLYFFPLILPSFSHFFTPVISLHTLPICLCLMQLWRQTDTVKPPIPV